MTAATGAVFLSAGDAGSAQLDQVARPGRLEKLIYGLN